MVHMHGFVVIFAVIVFMCLAVFCAVYFVTLRRTFARIAAYICDMAKQPTGRQVTITTGQQSQPGNRAQTYRVTHPTGPKGQPGLRV